MQLNSLKYFSTLLLFLLSSCTSLFYQPDRYLYTNPKDYQLKFENFYFKSSDNIKLHAWHFKNSLNPSKPKGLILQFHGNAENMSTHYLSLAWITKFGYDLLAFDYRGYGTSEGKPSKDGLYRDSIAALNFTETLIKKMKISKFIVYGQSLGGALAAKAVANYKNKKVIDLLVLDSTFMDYKEVAAQTLSSHWPTWPFTPLAYILVSNKYKTTDDIAGLKESVLVIHGKKDRIVKFKNGEAIYETLSTKNKKFWQIDDGRHIDVFNRKDDFYRKKFIKYLDNLKSEYK